MNTPFSDRHDAGRRLSDRLRGYAGRPDVIVVGLPRGGVPVAFEVARVLRVPLETFVVRKLGVPGHEELAMGAIAPGGITVLEHDVVRQLGIPSAIIDRVVRAQQRELERREQLYRGGRAVPDLRGRTVIMVDDGIATGATVAAAVAALRELRPAKIIVAAPVASRHAAAALEPIADACVFLAQPEPFYGVGTWYRDFSQTTDDEVRWLLAEAEEEANEGVAAAHAAPV